MPTAPGGLADAYIISKTAQTLFTQMYHHVYDLPTIGLNIQNCYGPRERPILNPNPMRPHEGRKLVASKYGVRHK